MGSQGCGNGVMGDGSPVSPVSLTSLRSPMSFRVMGCALWCGAHGNTFLEVGEHLEISQQEVVFPFFFVFNFCAELRSGFGSVAVPPGRALRASGPTVTPTFLWLRSFADTPRGAQVGQCPPWGQQCTNPALLLRLHGMECTWSSPRAKGSDNQCVALTAFV